ncbi:MAG: hypothetical protein BIP78_1159 [Candidatus Bipolaricaulis sibiricus]|uniref:Uncharacterized protein n=1 Tax=Bipolaricaulis sibiricus TaxID=2501609 RepID=A0A410FUY0_BIPS1|nr:MAG: hypothetical protein BIP78_1159 [Candidatus Bipolaricaulis sibiricus]
MFAHSPVPSDPSATETVGARGPILPRRPRTTQRNEIQ